MKTWGVERHQGGWPPTPNKSSTVPEFSDSARNLDRIVISDIRGKVAWLYKHNYLKLFLEVSAKQIMGIHTSCIDSIRCDKNSIR